MDSLLVWMEGTAIATWVRESPSLWAYPTILALHSFGLAVVVGASTVVDARLLGFGRRLRPSALKGLFPIMWWAFALNAVSGWLLFMADATRKSAQPIFYVKLGCIAIAIACVALIGRRIPASGDVTPGQGRVLAIVSLLCWTGAITAGRFMAYL